MKESNGDLKSKVLKSSKKKKTEGLASVCIGNDLLQIHGETSQQNKIKRNKENRGWSRRNKEKRGWSRRNKENRGWSRRNKEEQIK